MRRSEELCGGRRFSSLGFISAPFVLSEIKIGELICLRGTFNRFDFCFVRENRNRIVFSSGVNYLNSGGNIQSE